MEFEKKEIIDYVDGVAITTTKDAHGETLTLKDLEKISKTIMKNSFVFDEHDQSFPPIGMIVKYEIQEIKKNVYGLYIKIGVYDKKQLETIQNGIKTGLSISYNKG